MLKNGYRPHDNSIDKYCKTIGFSNSQNISSEVKDIIKGDMDRILKEDKNMPRKKVVPVDVETIEDENMILNSEVMSKRKTTAKIEDDLYLGESKEEPKNLVNKDEKVKGVKVDMEEFKEVNFEISEDKVEETGKYKMHKDLCNSIHKLYVEKNEAYGDSVSDTFNRYGMISFIVRLMDKLNRASNLVTMNLDTMNDESLIDTLQDLANYSLMAIVELKDKKSDNK